MSRGIDPAALAPPPSPDWTRPVNLDGAPRQPTLPSEGESVFGFRLGRELGRGSFACVYLAGQADLAGRPVVLKVSGIDGDEPQTLAQLQHTHIVPIYSVHEDPVRGLRAVCMPYFGGASLARVLDQLWKDALRPATGAQLVRALAATQVPPVPDSGVGNGNGSGQGEVLALLGRLRYDRAAAWLVARLAEALQHAHDRGVLHCDVKPSNILLGADGQPMLLDFNVARRRDQATAATLGGTVAYMAPEHLRALAGADQGPAPPVDVTADVYSLGMVLYEMLAGRSPFDHDGSYSPLMPLLVAMALERSRGVPSLRARRPDAPWDLESIVRKCLDPSPARRYRRADHFAEDLRRFLNDQPLRHAPQLSQAERLRKWARRHPRLTSSGTVATVAAVLLAVGGATLLARLSGTREQLLDARAQEQKRSYEAGTVRALCLVNTTGEAKEHLAEGLDVCRRTLALYGVLDGDDWQQGPLWRRLTPAERGALAEDTRQLLLLLAWARVRTAPDDEAVLREALALLDRAEKVAGLWPSRALWEDRALYLGRLKRDDEARAARERAAEIEPADARDHYQLATALARAGRYAEAVVALDRALALDPRHYWSAVQRGICRQELGQFALAAGDFGVSVGLWPEFAWGHFNLGYALDRSGHKAEAVAAYAGAAARDPDFQPAYLNRGLARLELRQYAEALEDFDRLAALGRDDAVVHAGRGVALEGLRRHAAADEAFRRAFARGETADEEVRTRLGWVYGFAVSARLPRQAEAAFDDVLRRRPDHPQALYGRAMLLVEGGREPEALEAFGRLLEVTPGSVEARRYRAILLARCRKYAAASQDVNVCLDQEPKSAAVQYAAACVAALAARETSGPASAREAAGQALAFLKRAIAGGYGRDKAATDPDLKAIRNHPEFRRLLEPADGPR